MNERIMLHTFKGYSHSIEALKADIMEISQKTITFVNLTL